MNKANRTTTVEVLVGVLVFCILVLLGVFTIVLSEDSIFAKKYPMSIYFNSVSGLREGDNVLLRGVKVGVVKDIQVLPRGVLLHFSAEQPIKLYEDYRVTIQSSSALGGKFLNVYEGSVDKPAVQAGTTLSGDDPVVLMDDAAELLHELRIALKEGGALENLRIGMKNLAEVSDKINAGEGTVAKLINDDAVYNDIKNATSELKAFSEKLTSGEGTLAKLVNDGEAYERANKILEDLGTVSERLAEGEGTLGKLAADDELYVEVKKLVAELRAGIDDMREASPVTTFSSVMMGAF
ncbi:MlaD family protein [Verrucomicrobiota bacterium]